MKHGNEKHGKWGTSVYNDIVRALRRKNLWEQKVRHGHARNGKKPLEVRVDKVGAIKHDAGKNRLDLIPVQPLLEVGKVLTDGAKEYGDHNWRKGISYSRLYAAIQRHLLAFWKGEDIDQSGHRALAHACTDIMILMEMPKEWDDRCVSESIQSVTLTGEWPGGGNL